MRMRRSWPSFTSVGAALSATRERWKSLDPVDQRRATTATSGVEQKCRSAARWRTSAVRGRAARSIGGYRKVR